jgi:LEA14-like dessication related protein
MSIVLVAVLVCGGVLLAFMFPRSASLSLIAMHSSNTSVSYNLNSSITILIQTEVRIQNRNFFPLEVKGLTIYLYNIKTQVSDFTHDAFSVGARKSITHHHLLVCRLKSVRTPHSQTPWLIGSG